MNTVQKNWDNRSGGNEHTRVFLVQDELSDGEKSEQAMGEIHKRADEIGPVLEGILHIDCNAQRNEYE